MWTLNKYVIYYVHATMATFAFTASENNYTNRMIFLQYMQLTTIQCNRKQSNWHEKNENGVLTLVLFCLTPSTICSNCFKNCSRPLNDAIALQQTDTLR